MLIKTSNELLDKLARDNGVIVSTGILSQLEIADARACGRMYVNTDGLGFVYIPLTLLLPRGLSQLWDASGGEADCQTPP